MRTKLITSVLALVVWVWNGPCAPAAEELNILTPQMAGGDPRQMLYRHLKQQAYAAFEKRRAAYEQVKTLEQAEAYKLRMRSFFIEQLGGFPQRGPLNAKIVGTIERSDYKIEKIIFESQPRHFVTAHMYLPRSGGRFAVVLMPSGHSATGKMENQTNCTFLAKSGIAALCYDPIGQGERYQLLDDKGKPRFGSTNEHSLIGASCMLLGRSTATYRIWDGMRALDYLTSRPDIDPTKIGVSGCSGGGTLSSYLMALDDRIACAAPSCYLTTFHRLIDTIGPQDAEQNIHAQIAFGMDHADYVLMRAPRPTLILAASGDFFDIQGTWDTFRQAKRWYTRLGYPERVALVETDTKHGYPTPQREAMVSWMERWLVGRDQRVREPSIEALPLDQMLCTPRGQVMLLEDARSVVDLNIELNDQLEKERRKLWSGPDRQQALAAVRRIAGIRLLAEIPKPKVTSAGTIERDGYRIEKLVIEPEEGIMIPALLFQPAKANGPRCLYVNGDGKQADAQVGGAIEKLVLAGQTVLAPDLGGMGETGPARPGLWGGSFNEILLAYLLDKPMVGMWAEDMLACARYLGEMPGTAGAAKVHLIAIGSAGPAAAHAAAVGPSIFADVRIARALRSWTEVVRHPEVPGNLVNSPHGALTSYDLPDLLNMLPANMVTIE